MNEVGHVMPCSSKGLLAAQNEILEETAMSLERVSTISDESETQNLAPITRFGSTMLNLLIECIYALSVALLLLSELISISNH